MRTSIVGWSSWTEVRLDLGDEGARLHLPDGRAVVFPRLGTGWDRAAGENLWLGTAEDGRLVVTSSAGLRWLFDADGRLRETSSGPGTRVEFAHDLQGRLVRMAHERGRGVGLVWDDTSSLVVAAHADDGREVRHAYEDGRLVATRSPSGARRYAWDEAGLVASVTDADGVVEVSNRYDEAGRVVEQRSPFGRTTRFVYLPGGITEVSDADGERSNTWVCDSRGRLVGVVDAEGRRQSTSYDRHGNPVMVTQRDGSAVLSFYDDRGRRVRQVTPTGADLSWTYDDADRPVEVGVEADGQTATTRLRYEGASRNPFEVVDAEGGVTTMSWHDGLLTEVVDPEGVRLRFGYDDRGDLVSSTDADGEVARLERDALGRVVAAVTPLGHRTTYRYDGTGPLLSRQDAEGGTWRYEHTPAGRLHAVVDPTGGRTEIEHGAHGLPERTIDPLGRAVSSAYDDLGNRRRVELPDGTAWGYDHDAMSRLVATTDPTGATWRLGHDAQGDLVETLDPTGVRRTVERDVAGRPVRTADAGSTASATYDALGRMLTESGSDGSTHHYRYDRCGRLVAHTDATGGTTLFRHDRAGRPVAVTHPGGSTFGYAYDACGRRAATIDTDGSRYGFSYDADGRLVGEHWPTGEHAWVRYDAVDRVVERSEPGRGTARFGYDGAGRVVRATDPWSGQRRFRYDAAGQLVAATDALGGTTRFEHDEGGRCVAIVDPLGGRRERSFDALGRITAETDPLGRTTSYAYDAAGRQTRRVDAAGAVRSWVYDDAGRICRSYAGETLLSSVGWDGPSRTLQVHEHDVVHELVFDAGGRLVRRMRGSVGVSWSYDADGRRTSFTGPHGEQTRYSYDAAGRVSAFDAPGLGRAVLDRDAIGRVVALSAPGLHAVWTWEDGAVVRLEVRRGGASQVTELERDEAGRVVAESVDGRRTTYAYDAAGQLVSVRGEAGPSSEYTYDAAGRLVRETTGGEATRYVHDVAGQLLARRSSTGTSEYRYDTVGRRVAEDGPEGERRFAWDERGFLRSVTTLTRTDDRVSARTHLMRVDALGELADLDGAPVLWDSAATVPSLAHVGGLSVAGFGPLTGLLPDPGEGSEGSGGRWLTPGARSRATSSDPWAVPTGTDPEGLAGQVAVGQQGGLLVDGLEWMHNRVYDPASRGFLSVDPLEPALGATGWGNPYAFAGNDPRNASDPWGLAPVSDADLQAYRDSNNGSLRNAASAATSWVKDNWEYIAAGALIVGGVAVMCTGIGGPIGAAMIGGALMSGGLSAGMQKHETGSVDWGKVGVDAAIGGVAGLAGGGAGVAVARTAARSSLNCLGRNMLTGAVAGAADGSVSGGLSYATSGQPVTAAGLARATLSGGGQGLVGGAATAGVLTKVSGSACFVAGTQVLLGDGTSASIEDLAVGDEVQAADPGTGAVLAREVVDTYVTPDVETYAVETSTGTVVSTAEHPFWVDGRGWVPVRDLAPGDKLVDADGVRVELVSVTATGQTATVYNIHVEGLHTYHVRAGDDWIRVHNSCTTDAEGLADLASSRADLGLPAPGRGSPTLSRLDVGDAEPIYGVSAHGQPVDLRVNPISRTHAETDALQQLANSGGGGGRSGTMYIDHPDGLCGPCGRSGAVRSMAGQTGLSELRVVWPDGSTVLTP